MGKLKSELGVYKSQHAIKITSNYQLFCLLLRSLSKVHFNMMNYGRILMNNKKKLGPTLWIRNIISTLQLQFTPFIWDWDCQGTEKKFDPIYTSLLLTFLWNIVFYKKRIVSWLARIIPESFCTSLRSIQNKFDISH